MPVLYFCFPISQDKYIIHNRRMEMENNASKITIEDTDFDGIADECDTCPLDADNDADEYGREVKWI